MRLSIKKYPVVTLLFLLLWLFLPIQVTHAHVLKTDKTIGIVFHVDPDDDPVPGEQAHLYFLFDDTTKKFQLTKCNCIVSISEEGKQILQQQLIEKTDKKPSVWGASMPFTFPNRDVYHITITGNSIQPNAFQPFTLSWDFRVDENNVLGATQERPPDPTFPYFAIGFLSIPILGGLGIFWLIKKSGES